MCVCECVIVCADLSQALKSYSRLWMPLAQGVCVCVCACACVWMSRRVCVCVCACACVCVRTSARR